MLATIFVVIFAFELAPVTLAELPLNMEACSIGDVVENKCTKCICTVRNIYECKPKPCYKSLQDNMKHKGVSCQPRKVYHQLSTICICSADGSWPHDSCDTTFRLLPAANIARVRCTGKYATVGCNLCMCNRRGQIETDRCTRNECAEDTRDHRRKAKSSQLYGNCKAHNWYSLAPCQLCYCVNNNKLSCTVNNNMNGIHVGSYNFSHCGPEFLKEAMDLVPNPQKENIMRMDDGDTMTAIGVTKSRKPKSFEFQEVFEIANRESMQQKDDNTGEREEYKPIEREGTRQPYNEMESGNESGSNNKADDEDVADDDYKSVEDKLTPMLSEVFNGRRTVTLNSQSKCVPGSHLTVRCNSCHCMKNGKMLCTDRKCH